MTIIVVVFFSWPSNTQILSSRLGDPESGEKLANGNGTVSVSPASSANREFIGTEEDRRLSRLVPCAAYAFCACAVVLKCGWVASRHAAH